LSGDGTERFERLEMIAGLLRAMGDPSRLRLLQALNEGDACVGELAKSAGLSNANASKHLSILRQVGLVEYTRQGNSKCFALTSSVVTEVCTTVIRSRGDDS